MLELTAIKLTRRTNLRALVGGSAAGALALAAGAAGSTGVASAQTAQNVIPINFTSALGSFVGQFTVTRFALQNGQLVAVGTLTGTVRDALGAIVGTVNQALTLPVNLAQSSGSCEILTLVLGPLDLNLLGLRVQLNQIVLRITGQRGSGNLLGNLLCGIAGALDGGVAGAELQGLVRLLNQLLGLLG